ncbi:hypothetical protein RFF05_16285 [Bengtsoniella intestinalis]|uniref:hypothetical protein n=1 Tax=Bengtsoniella intestinalis TaxID=3073143 RepID=UPI00391F98DB
MKHYIYIKNDEIQLVSKKGKDYTYTTVPVQPGAIVNGVIMRHEDIKQAISQLSPMPKAVTLVVDSTNIIIKKVEMPKISSSQLDQMIKGEFDLFQREDKYLFDANVVEQTATTMSVLCYAVAKDFLDGYLSIFKDLKIKIRRIDTVMNSVIKYVATVPTLQSQTFVLNIVVGDNLLSILFEQGSYKFSNRSRLMGQDNSAMYSQNLFARLSSMVQFSQSERSKFPIGQSYYIGVPQEQLAHLSVFMTSAGSDIEPLMFPNGGFDLPYFAPYMGQLVNKRDVNLLVNKQEARQKQKVRNGLLIRGLILVVLCGVLAFRGYTIYQEDKQLQSQIDTLNAYFQSEAVATELLHYNTLQGEKDNLIAQSDEFFLLDSQLQGNKRFDSNSLTTLLQEDLIINFTYNISGQSLEITGSAPSSAVAVAYIEALRETGYFENLRYTGYSKEESGVSPAGTSILTVTYEFVAYAQIPALESEVANEAE